MFYFRMYSSKFDIHPVCKPLSRGKVFNYLFIELLIDYM